MHSCTHIYGGQWTYEKITEGSWSAPGVRFEGSHKAPTPKTPKTPKTQGADVFVSLDDYKWKKDQNNQGQWYLMNSEGESIGLVTASDQARMYLAFTGNSDYPIGGPMPKRMAMETVVEVLARMGAPFKIIQD